MRVLVSGGTGFIGEALVPRLLELGHEPVVLTRSPGSVDGPAAGWNPGEGRLDPGALDGVDAVVHLAGESIAGRFTDAHKRRVRESRVDGTSLLARAVASATPRPAVMVSASAVGYYGDGGDAELTETSPLGTGFLAEVCRDWEDAARPAAEAGVRLVTPRIGVVLGPGGGALSSMLLPFKLGVGGRIGSGKQWMAWVSRDDVVGAVIHLLASAIEGPVNVTAPEPARNVDFTRALGKALHRPTVLPLPAFAARLALGEMADEMLLVSQRVRPAKLEQNGYTFVHPTLEAALAAALR